ncbi:hypothetical protein [Methanosarcina barkeri]|nr:hypothetical protein [Methanosarcina barkeri]
MKGTSHHEMELGCRVANLEKEYHPVAVTSKLSEIFYFFWGILTKFGK